MLARSSNSVQDMTGHHHRHHRHHHHPSSGLRGHFGIELLGGFIPAGVLGERTRRAYSESVFGLRTRTCPIGLGGNAHARNWRRFSTRTTRNFADHESRSIYSHKKFVTWHRPRPSLILFIGKEPVASLGSNPHHRRGSDPHTQQVVYLRSKDV